jgi:hypothetical protein
VRNESKPLAGHWIEIRYKSTRGYGAEDILTDASGSFVWSVPEGVLDVFFCTRQPDCKARVFLPDESKKPRLWRPGQVAKYETVNVAALTGSLRGTVIALF